MGDNKVIRSVCYFTQDLTQKVQSTLDMVVERLVQSGFVIQTKRVCTKDITVRNISQSSTDSSLLLSVGTLTLDEFNNQSDDFLTSVNLSCNIDLTDHDIQTAHVTPLFNIIKNKPALTFNFTYVFHNTPSSPFFPSATYQKDGYSIGLQSTDLADGCHTLDEWLKRMESVWAEVMHVCSGDEDFLGIDASIAPLFTGKSSFVHFVKKLGMDFSQSTTTPLYTEITAFLKNKNPKPVGLCGLMFPCLEDFELADEYSQGNFTIERNIYLSLHSGLGIDVYPIGVDESSERVLELLTLMKNLSAKYQKPLSVRFVSDGVAKVGDTTDFQNKYLKDVIVRKL